MFRQLEPLPEREQTQLQLLRECLASLARVCVAYSGGVDSALVAAIAHEQLGFNAFAVTGVSPALAPYLLEEARQQAAWIDIRHHECVTSELEDPAYRKNPVDRCFACKREL
ncbi:MAG: asparagine synthase-related protein, partial [Prochlorococcus sp.]